MHWLWNILGLNNKNDWTRQPVKLKVQDEAQPINCTHMIYPLNPPPVSTILHGLKITKLNKINIPTSKSSITKVNFSPRWRNILEYLLLNTITDYTEQFIMLTNNIYYNPIPYMVFPFLLVPLHRQEKYQERERKRVHTANKKFQAQRKT